MARDSVDLMAAGLQAAEIRKLHRTGVSKSKRLCTDRRRVAGAAEEAARQYCRFDQRIADLAAAHPDTARFASLQALGPFWRRA
jgi:hypothetical protein